MSAPWQHRLLSRLTSCLGRCFLLCWHHWSRHVVSSRLSSYAPSPQPWRASQSAPDPQRRRHRPVPVSAPGTRSAAGAGPPGRSGAGGRVPCGAGRRHGAGGRLGQLPGGACAGRCGPGGRRARGACCLCACALSHLPRSCGRLWSRAGPLRAARAGGQLCAAAGLRIGRLVRGGRYFCSSGCRCVLVIPDLLRPWAMRARACCKVSSWAAGARCSACGVVRRGSRHDDCVFHCPHVIRSSLGCAAAGTRARCGWPSRERWSSARDVLLRCYAQGYAARWGMRWLSALAPPACGPSAWLPTGRRASLRAVLQELACLPACCAAGACTQERVRLEELAHLSVPGWRSLRASVCGLQGLARFSVANLPCTRLD
jgi:hypothetical protein